MKSIKGLFFVGLLFIGVWCFMQKMQRYRQAVISVYVHGTLFNWRKLLSYMPYARELTYAPDGLTHVDKLDHGAVAQVLANIFCTKYSCRFIKDNFYAFGWNGKLCFDHRKKAAQALAKELVTRSQEYETEYGVKPTIRIVSFSHGGNVALNLGRFLPDDYQIELFLIACPIQAETEQMVSKPCFSKLYVISSLNDWIQVVDPQRMYGDVKKDDTTNFSRRFIASDCDKIKQACVSVNGTYLGHLELFQLFNKHVPTVLQRLDLMTNVCGNKVADIDIDDPNFPFLHGTNFLDVIQGICSCD